MPDDAQPWSVAWSRAVLEPGGFYRRDAGHAEDHFPTFVTRDARTARRIAAIAAPALWFLASWVLTRGRAAWIRVAVLLAGVVLLVPWPFVTVGVIGS